MKKIILIIVVLLIVFAAPVVLHLCPPAGPWPNPPWCTKGNIGAIPPINLPSNSQLGNVSNNLINEIAIATNQPITGVVKIMAPLGASRVVAKAGNNSFELAKFDELEFKGSLTLQNGATLSLSAFDAANNSLGSGSAVFGKEVYSYISPQGSGRELIKGYTITACHYCSVSFTRGNYLPKVDSAYDLMKSEGTNWININPVWFLTDFKASDLRPIYREEYGQDGWSGWMHATISDDELRELIRKAHAKGLKVFLMPHLSTLNWSENVPGKGSLAPTDVTGFFENYTKFQLHYAKIAQEEGVELYSVGNELDSVTDDGNQINSGYNKTEKWRNIISAVRGVYNGKVTYSCSCTQADNQCTPEQIKFWDALDYIGFEWYVPLTSSTTTTVSELTNYASSILSNKVIPLSNKYGKQVIFTEYGWEAKPYSWAKTYGGGGQGNFNKEHAAVAYEAMFEALKNTPQVAGMFINTWPLGDEKDMTWIKDYNGLDTRYSILEAEIAKWYSWYK
ncbi:MAG: hypothetical protein V1722_00945 [Candidatus Micrarchaeota archaeon]